MYKPWREASKSAVLTLWWWSVRDLTFFQQYPEVWALLCFPASHCVTAHRWCNWGSREGSLESLHRQHWCLIFILLASIQSRSFTSHLLKWAGSTGEDKDASSAKPSEGQTGRQHLQTTHLSYFSFYLETVKLWYDTILKDMSVHSFNILQELQMCIYIHLNTDKTTVLSYTD